MSFISDQTHKTSKFETQKQKLYKIKQKEKKTGEKMYRALMICGTISSDLRYWELEFQKEKGRGNKKYLKK